MFLLIVFIFIPYHLKVWMTSQRPISQLLTARLRFLHHLSPQTRITIIVSRCPRRILGSIRQRHQFLQIIPPTNSLVDCQ
jgi:hypothetical protein